MEQGIIMLLGLSKIMQKPDSVLPFHTALDLHDLQFGGSFPVQEPVSAEGTVRNTAGVLVLEAVISTNLQNMDSKLLCRPDCKGICPRCGKNLNEGACSCRPEIDPRLAVLGQLLKDK